MDLGIAGRTAIVCGASRGLGHACARSLAGEGVVTYVVARTAADIEAAAEDIAAATGTQARPVAADITTEEGRNHLLGVCPGPDILVTNAGGPPHGDFRDFRADDWLKAMNGNMVSAIELIRRTLDAMIDRRFGRIVNITSSSVKAPIPELPLSNAARAGLTGFVGGLSRQTVRHNVTVNNLLPGKTMTERLRTGMTFRAERAGVSIEEMYEATAAEHPAGRLGDPAEFGDVCAFLCSAQAGYLTGQNVIFDGGNYRGLL